MRKFLTIGTLALMMFGLLYFDFTQSWRLPFEPKVLAASGFILLTAYTMGEIVQRFGPPKLVGYIVTGVLFGPYLTPLVFGPEAKVLFSRDVVDDLSLINALAQGLIGLTAGGELLFKQLKPDLRNIGFTLGAETLVVFAAVGAVVALLAVLVPSSMPFLVGSGTVGIVAAVLLFGSLAVGTSPSTTLAVITETAAQGPLKRVTLGLVVAKDVSTVILFLTCLPIAAALLSPEGVTLSTEFAKEIFELLLHELGGAILAGAVLGVLIWVYLRWIRAELLLFVIGVVFVGMWAAKELHFEALLMFIVAGFFVANKIPFTIWRGIRAGLFRRPFSAADLAEEDKLDLGHVLIHELERLALPVFVIFFTIAAAKLELAALSKFWLIALAYVVVRAAAMFLGTQLGVKLAGATPLIRNKLWMGMFPQAGVTLTLAALAADKIPWANDYATIIMATILVNIVVGPTLLKAALTQAGETRSDPDAPADAQHAPNPEAPPPSDAEPAASAAQASDTVKLVKEFGRRQASRLASTFVTPSFSDDALNDPLLRLRRRLLRIYAAAERGYLRDHHEQQVATYKELEEAVFAELVDTHANLLEQVAAQFEIVDDDHELLHELPPCQDREKLKQLLRDGKARLVQRLHVLTLRHIEDFPSSGGAENLLLSLLEQVEAAVDFDPPFVEAAQDDACFEPIDTDGVYVRAVKRLKRVGRSFGGFRTRIVDLFLLTRYFVELPMPGRLLTLANFLGGQQRFVWIKARNLYRLADTIYLEALAHLDDAPMRATDRRGAQFDAAVAALADADPSLFDPLANPAQVIEHIESALRAEPLDRPGLDEPSTIERLERFFANRMGELQQESTFVLDDLETFADDVRFLAKETFSHPFSELVDACAIAGTFELRKRRFRATRLFDDNRQKRTEMLDAARNWAVFNRGVAGRFAAELEVAVVHGRLRNVLTQALRVADDQLLSALSYYPIELGLRVDETRLRLDSMMEEDADPEKIRKAIVQERALLLAFINQTALGDMEEVHESRRFSDITGALLDGLEIVANQASPSIEVAPEEMLHLDESVGFKGDVRLIDVPFRDLLKEMLEREIAVQISDVEIQLLTLIEHTSSDLMELGQIIGFNLDAAASELVNPGGSEIAWPQTHSLADDRGAARRRYGAEQLRTDDGHLTYAGLKLPREFAIDGLQRALERIDHLVERVSDEGRSVKELIRAETVKQARHVHGVIHDNTAEAIRQFITHREVSKALRLGGKTPTSVIGRLRAWSVQGWEIVTRPLRRDVAERNRQHAHDRPDDPLRNELVDIDSMLDVWNSESLPNIYRRLFSPTPNEVAEFFVGRPELVQRFNHAIDQWLHGNFAAMALIGEPGSGRTSFVDQMLRTRLQGMPVYRRKLNHTIRTEGALVEEFSAVAGGRRNIDLDTLKATIRSRKERSVVVIEESENLFIRSLDGLRTLRDFLNLVTETGDRVLWILSMDAHAWNYLDMVVDINQHFTHPMRLRALRRDEVSELILSRHRMSGYALHFTQPLTGLQRLRAFVDRVIGHPEEEQALAQRAFFEQLHHAAGGNPMMGIFLWLRSIQTTEDEGRLDVLPIAPLQLRSLEKLDDDKLLILANVLLHNGLTVSEYIDIFRTDREQAQAALQYLFNLRMLHFTPTGTEASYRLRHVLYQAVARHLAARNML